MDTLDTIAEAAKEDQLLAKEEVGDQQVVVLHLEEAEARDQLVLL